MKKSHLILLLVLGGFLILLHQFVGHNVWFELGDIHHETFAVALFFGAAVLYFYQRRLNDGA